jgi:hypothetical protein
VPVDLAPSDLAGYEVARTWLAGELVAWGRAVGRGSLSPDTGEQLCHYKWGYLDDSLASWRCEDLDKILLELYPAKMMLAPDDADGEIGQAATFLSFLAGTALADPRGDPPGVLLDHLAGLGDAMRRRLADQHLYSWGKRMWLAMAREGITPDNPAAVGAWQARFHSLPVSGKEALIGGPLRNLPEWAGPGRFLPSSAHR